MEGGFECRDGCTGRHKIVMFTAEIGFDGSEKEEQFFFARLCETGNGLLVSPHAIVHFTKEEYEEMSQKMKEYASKNSN